MTLEAEAFLAPTPSPATPAREAAQPLRIAFLSYRSDPKVGGQGVYLAEAARALSALGHQVDVISGPPYPVLSEGVRLIKLPSLDLYAQPHNGQRALRWRHLKSWTDTAEYFGHVSGKFMEPWSFGRRAAKYLRQHGADYDVALDNQSLSSGLLAIERAGLPVVEVIHHPIRRDLELALAAEPKASMRWLKRRWYSFLSMQEKVAPQLTDVILVSEASARDVSECLAVRQDAMSVIHLGIDRQVFCPNPQITRDSARLLTTASADVPLKGLRYLIEAYGQLLQSHPELELVVIGTLRKGPTKDLLDSLGLADRVQFISNLTREEVVAQYAQATICVTPSLYEGFGLPAAEAMACGAPVVVTDGGALPEVVGEAGVVVRKADPGALASAIGQLLDDPAKREEMSRAGLERARERLSWTRAATAYEEVLRRAVARRC
ncbi:glycosyltransferase family 4 protein [Phenylobacterium koreense]|uniref:Glycosyltransferase involved in cell wall biosynthesis n=2 Tax=Phenylobacterium TaxID=20 RepID=A0ABV2EF39_9CAUL